MSRESYGEKQIPAAGHESPPYIDQREIINKFLRHGVESFMGEILGAGGAGGSLTGIPFEPAAILISDAAVPLGQLQFPGSAGKVDINLITLAAAGAAIPAATLQADGTYTLALPTGLAPDGNTVSVLIIGWRDVNGSL
jgi:hypothetical protein